MGDFTMPSLGAEMDEGRLIEWLVAPGDQVSRGDTVAVVETDKAALEVEVWESGIIEELLVAPGTIVPVGTPLARIGAAEGAPAPVAAASPAEIDRAVAPEPEPATAAPQPEPAPVAQPPATTPSPEPVGAAVGAPAVRGPLARHRAEDLHLDLTRLQGSGPGGVITRHDVEAAGTRPRVSPYARRLAAEQGRSVLGMVGSGPGGAVVARDVAGSVAAGAPAAGGVEPPSPPPERIGGPAPSADEGTDRTASMRAAIARAMAWSKQHIPHYYLGSHVDVTEMLDWLADHNAALPVRERVLPAAVFLSAVARAAHEIPDLNGFWQEDRFVPADSVHLGVGINLRGGGLVAPAILDADQQSLAETMAALKDLVQRARAGRLKARESTAGTITVTNLGDLGVETVYGVIYPPQVALVGIGRVVERPWAVDGLLGIRKTVHLTLSADHRASDGHVGARFLTRISELLARPEEL